jgi:hypothetical protein
MVGEEVVDQSSGVNTLAEGAGETRGLTANENFEQRPHQTWTYFIHGADAIKIGKSLNPRGRMAELQVGSGCELKLLLAVPYDRLPEASAHRKFKHLRLHGEWFRPEQDLLDFITALRVETQKPIRPARPQRPPPPDPLVGGIYKLRSAHGADTPIGHRYSNLSEMVPIYRNSTDANQKARIAAAIERTMKEIRELTSKLN